MKIFRHCHGFGDFWVQLGALHSLPIQSAAPQALWHLQCVTCAYTLTADCQGTFENGGDAGKTCYYFYNKTQEAESLRST